MSARRTPSALAAAAVLFVALAAAAGAASGAVQAQPASRASAAPLVQTMVVGSSGAVLAAARAVTAASASVRVGHRSCTVASGTPLAVLAALRRLGGPSFTLHDYGHCGGSATNSGQLFVNSLAGQPNRGQSGWEYKVGGVSGSTGAADPSGPAGDGRRLRAGAQLLWFYCRASGGGCQRSLEVAAPARIAPGVSLVVRVLGRDNEGRSAPVAGAIVKLGSDFASTAADGRATLLAPQAPGRYTLGATRNGLVPSFPATVTIA